MKRFYQFFMVIMALCIAGGVQAQKMIPDVMGYANIAEETSGIVEIKTINTDNFSVMAGWPVNVTGYGYEGGVFYNMDADPELEVIYSLGYQVFAFNVDGTNVTGWPQPITYYSQAAPAIGDVDGDDVDEIVVACNYGTTMGYIYAFEMDGSVLSGFPINHGYSCRTPVLADLDDDGMMEIITSKRLYPVGEWYVYSGDGTIYPGWPQSIGHVPSSSSAVGDVTGDGIPEIVGESYDALYVWDRDGNILSGFPFYMPNNATNSYSSPVIVDLDGDGLNEILFGTHVSGGGGYVFVLNGDGTEVPGWPQQTYSWIYGPPAVGYVDGDNELDVVVGDQVLSPSPMNFVYGWSASGNVLAGFPIGPIWSVSNQIALADLDGDGQTELMFDDNTIDENGEGKYHAYNHDGTPLAGFPLITLGYSLFNMTCLADLDNDGYLDMVGAGNSPFEGWTNIYVWESDTPYNADAIMIPCFQYNLQHTGVPEIEFQAPDLTVSMDPVNPPIVIPPEGGSFDFEAIIENLSSTTAMFDAWIEVDIPGGGTVSPVILREDLWLPGLGSVTRILTQEVPGAAPSGTYTYRLIAGSYPSTVYASDEFNFSKTGVSDQTSGDQWTLYGWEEDIMISGDLPSEVTLTGNYPNPFNSSTTISYTLPEAAQVSLQVYDLSGSLVAELAEGWRSAGRHDVHFNAEELSSGVYFYSLRVGNNHLSGKMLYMK